MYDSSDICNILDKFTTADKVDAWKRLETGCKQIDILTNGGIPLHGITEICGCSGVGKTQLCLQLAINIQLQQESKAVYICTESVFPSKRFHQMCRVAKERHKHPFEDNVYLHHLSDVQQFMQCLSDDLPKLLDCNSIGLIIVDSIAGLFRNEGEMAHSNYIARSHHFVALVDKLKKLAGKYDVGVVIVNQMTDNLDSGKTDPALGIAWSNLVTSRFLISRLGESLTRTFKVVYSPNLAGNHKASFTISSSGITG